MKIFEFAFIVYPATNLRDARPVFFPSAPICVHLRIAFIEE
jgi:hypothetical protein